MPQKTSDEKYKYWCLRSSALRDEDIATEPDQLTKQIEEVQGTLSEIREHMDDYFQVAPRVKQAFELREFEIENRRTPVFVEDALTGDKIYESELLKRDFKELEFEVRSKVVRFRALLRPLEKRKKALQLKAVQLGLPSQDVGVVKTGSEDLSAPTSVAPMRSPEEKDLKNRREVLANILESDPLLTHRKICGKLDFLEISVPVSWQTDFGVKTWVAAYENKIVREERLHKLLSSDKKKVQTQK